MCPAGVEDKTGEVGWGFRELLCPKRHDIISTSWDCSKGSTTCRKCQNGTWLGVHIPLRWACGYGMASALVAVTDVAVGITMATTLWQCEEDSPEGRAGWDFPALGFTDFDISWIWDFLNRGLKKIVHFWFCQVRESSFQGESTFPMSKQGLWREKNVQ